MEDVVFVSGVRTPIGRFQGAFANMPASDLAAVVIREAVSRAGLTPAQVDHVVFGCVGQVMEDGYLSRHASVKAGMPIETPAVTVNRICGSGLEAINTAARYIQTGDATIVVAGGAENMTMMPYYVRNGRTGYRMGNGTLEDGILHLLGDPFSKQHMGITAENLAESPGRSGDALPGARRRRYRRRQVQGRDRAGRSEVRQGNHHHRHR